MRLTELQELIDKWIKVYGVRYFDEMTNTLLLSEEIGEFSRLIARKYGEQSFKTEKGPDEINSSIKDEIGDILFVLACLSNQMGYSLEEIMIENLNKKTNRDNMRHKMNNKLS